MIMIGMMMMMMMMKVMLFFVDFDIDYTDCDVDVVDNNGDDGMGDDIEYGNFDSDDYIIIIYNFLLCRKN